MAKKITKIVKMILPAGALTPAPPYGPSLSQAGVQIKQFCDEFNQQTQKSAGLQIPTIIKVFEDRTYTFELKTPPVSQLIKVALKIKNGSGKPNLEKVGTLTKQQVEEIAKQKLVDLNTISLESAINIVKGTAKQMGIICE